MKQTVMTLAEETEKVKKEIKKAGSHTGLGALLYIVVLGIVSVIGMIPIVFQYIHAGQTGQILSISTADLVNMFMDHPYTGTAFLAGSLIALLAVFLFFLKQGTHKQLFCSTKAMTLKKFGVLLCVMYLFSAIGEACYQLIEMELNLFGFSTSLGKEMASGNVSNLPMFLYAGVVGPIVEELVFRGLLLRRLEKHGKLVAIFATSVLFGLMHENLPQVLSATMIGFVLGYIALEYSVIWSVVLHIFNNLVMCITLTRVLEGANELVQNLIYRGFTWVTVMIAIVSIVRSRKSVVDWIRNHMGEKCALIWVFTSGGMLVAIVFFIIGTMGTVMLG